MAEAVLTEVKDGVLTLTLNKPDKLNALDAPMAKTVYEELKAAENDPKIRVVVITAAGRGFSAGADIVRDRSDEGAGGVSDSDSLLNYANQSVELITRLSKPVVAAVNGVAAGVGVSYALAADIVIAKESASFLLAFSRIGLMPDGGATLWVSAAIGRARAMDMALMADKIPATQAKEWGLITRVAPDEEFDAEVAKVVQQLAAGPTRAYAKTKAAINAASVSLLAESLEREVKGQTELLTSKDHAEGAKAFAEKRQAQFTGE